MTQQEQDRFGPFVDTGLRMVRQVLPSVRALVDHPDRQELSPRVVGSCFCLVRFVIGKAGELGLEHLAELAAALEYLLDRVRSGVLLLTTRRIGLVAETCVFLEQGMELIAADRSDARLARSAAVLAAAIRLATREEESDRGWDGEVAPLSAHMWEVFFWETNQLLNAIEQECVLWDFIAGDLERVAELSRIVRRLKQHFTLYGFRDPERVCQVLECTLRRYAEGEFFQTEYPERIFLRCIDALRAAVAGYSPVIGIVLNDGEHHLDALQGMIRQPIGELLVEAGLVDSETVHRALEVQHAVDKGPPPRLGELLIAMGEVTSEEVQTILRQQHDKRSRAAEAEATLTDRCDQGLEDRLTFGHHEVLVDGRRLRRMGALIEQLAVRGLSPDQKALVAELQAQIRACGQEAFASLARRLQRVAQDVAFRMDKRVHCTIDGLELLQETEDVSELAEALVHLVEHCAKHNLESVEDRHRIGKRATGRIDLLVFRHGAEVWASVEDDGRGMGGDWSFGAGVQPDRAATKSPRDSMAGYHGLHRRGSPQSESAVSGPSETDSPPGLVAAQTVVDALGGCMHLTSRMGKGTCITLRVPRRG